VQPDLHGFIPVFALPLEVNSEKRHAEALKRLPEFGRGGIPFVERYLKAPWSTDPKLVEFKSSNLDPLLEASIEALGLLGKNHDEALKLLVTLTEKTELAKRYYKLKGTLQGHCKNVAAQLQSIVRKNPDIRKRIIEYSEPLQESTIKENKELGYWIRNS
jgi:hypothetical protein